MTRKTHASLEDGFWRSGLYLAAIVAFLVSRWVHFAELDALVSTLAVAAIVASLPTAGWGPRILTFGFLATGYWMLIRTNASPAQYLLAHGSMLYLLALFAVLPILSIPVELGNYAYSIEKVLRSKVSNVVQLNSLVTALAFVCGSFMSLAAIPIMMTSLAPVVEHYPLKNSLRFRSVAATYGYVLPILWTPVSGVVGVVLQILNLAWTPMLPSLIGLSIAALLVNWLVFYLFEYDRTTKGTVSVIKTETPETRRAVRHLGQILLAVFVMVISIAALDHILNIGMLTVVTLVAIPFSFFWSFAIGRQAEFVKAAKERLTVNVSLMSDQFAIFLSAGFFVTALHLSGLDHRLNMEFMHLHHLIGTKFLLLAMPFMSLAAAMFGIHPVVSIALLGESLKPEVLGIDASLLALTLIGSAVLTYMLGPFGGTLGLMQSLTRVSSYRLAMWNLPYAFGYWILLSVIIAVY